MITFHIERKYDRSLPLSCDFHSRFINPYGVSDISYEPVVSTIFFVLLQSGVKLGRHIYWVFLRRLIFKFLWARRKFLSFLRNVKRCSRSSIVVFRVSRRHELRAIDSTESRVPSKLFGVRFGTWNSEVWLLVFILHFLLSLFDTLSGTEIASFRHFLLKQRVFRSFLQP